MENCQDCPCKCKPISEKCIKQNANIQDTRVLDTDHYTKASDDIDSLIGEDCADQLCEALKQAAIDAEANGNSIEDNLAQIWLNIINNKHFQKWYSNRLLFHWAFGASISKISMEGLVDTSNTDTQYKNGFVYTAEKERKRIQESAQFYADEARAKFLDRFWYKNIKSYPCYKLDCGCTKHYKCELHCPPKPSVRMRIV